MKKILRHWVLGIVLRFGLGGAVQAQTSLAGRTYRSANMFMEMLMKDKGDEVNEKLKDPEKRKEFQEKMGKAMSMYTIVIFKTDATLTMKSTAYIDEDLLKQAGVGWAKRKLMKVAFKAMNHEEDMPYRVQGSLVIAGKGSETDTLRLSTDGKQLTMTEKKDKKTETITMTIQK